MSTSVLEEMTLTYVFDYNDFTDELSNDLSPIISQLFELDSKLVQNIDKIEDKMLKMKGSAKIKNKIYYSEKVNKYLGKIKRVTKKKIDLSTKIKDIIEKTGKKLTEDYEGLLLCKQTQSLTYGTRSGKIWTE